MSIIIFAMRRATQKASSVRADETSAADRINGVSGIRGLAMNIKRNLPGLQYFAVQ